MDDLIGSMIAGLVAMCIAGVMILVGIFQLLVLELHAITTGDTGFILASFTVLFILCAAYAGTGLWLRSTGRI